jgi:hypothetical protein
MIRRLTALLGTLALVPSWPAAAPVAEGATAFDNLVASRYVHCAFYRDYEKDRRTGDLLLVEGNSLTHFQHLREGYARQISTRVAGAREVKVMNSGKYLHFVDQMAGMYVLTTVYSCLDHDSRTGVCITYGAVQSRQFDSKVLSDPDAVYEATKGSADPGFCDHSFFNLEAATRK